MTGTFPFDGSCVQYGGQAMCVLVCGDRAWKDRNLLNRVLDHVWQITGGNIQIIHGGATGADTMAGQWATSRALHCTTYPADWKTYGRAAGPIRNALMLRDGRPDVVYAFHDDLEASKGTKDMVKRAKDAGVPVYVVKH